jgi:hypothetical protein
MPNGQFTGSNTNSTQGSKTLLLLGIFAVVCTLPRVAMATPSFGQTTSPALRAKVLQNLNANHWGSMPLFNLQLQSSPDNWGFDVVQVEAQFAPADASGKPGSSGWHSHPAAIAMVQVVQGTGSVLSAEDRSCLTVYPTGAVFFEQQGNVHHLFNMDPKIPLVIRVTFFVERNITATRTDEADPATGSLTSANPPPSAVCGGGPGQ